MTAAVRLLVATLALASAALLVGARPAAAGGTSGGRADWATATIGVAVEWVPARGSGSSGSGPAPSDCVVRSAEGRLDPDRVVFDLARLVDDTWYILYERVCDGVTVAMAWVPQLAGRELATVARDEVQRRLPAPVVGLAPAPGQGVVHVPAWIWAEPASWQPVSVTATLPGQSATVTALPRRLTFDPGDGGLGTGVVRCDGPGEVWRPADGDEATSACMYTWHHASSLSSSGRWPAELAVEWAVTFAASDGTGGDLGTLRTASGVAVRVDELQALVVGGS